jgi:hypothetical protein
MTEIAGYIFCGCSAVTQLASPSGVMSNGGGALMDTGLAQVTIPPNVKMIGIGTFSDCSALTEVTILSTEIRVRAAAFNCCSSLQSLTIPANAEIEDRHDLVFNNVTTLEHVMLVGSPLNPALVANVAPALAPGATIVGEALAGMNFGSVVILPAP